MENVVKEKGPILDVKDLRVSYHTYAGEVQSVRGVSFDVDRGQVLAIAVSYTHLTLPTICSV